MLTAQSCNDNGNQWTTSWNQLVTACHVVTVLTRCLNFDLLYRRSNGVLFIS